jgi:hypothetical protein
MSSVTRLPRPISSIAQSYPGESSIAISWLNQPAEKEKC